MKYIPWIFGTIITTGILISLIIASGNSIDVLDPVGEIASRQKDLLYFAVGLSLLVALPVFGLTIYIAQKYQAGKKSKYSPDWDSNSKLEATWWVIPMLLILILAIVTWQTTHSLDPYKPLDYGVESLEVQAVALEWKWLFIYPKYDIATINELVIPKDVPISFKITADAPMNALWIPALGTQIYAMNGMQSQLNLVSNEVSTVKGRSSNISGEGFSNMQFDTITLEQSDFDKWHSNVQKEGFTMSIHRYDKLAEPSIPDNVSYFSKIEPNLFKLILAKYPGHGGH